MLEDETEHEIKKLKSRIALLKQRMEDASEQLQVANPDHAAITQYVETGFEKVVFSSRCEVT